MADQNKRDVELVIRAREVNLQAFDKTSAAVRKLTGDLDKQIDAASRGEVSSKRLADTLGALEKAGRNLVSQQAAIDRYKALSVELDKANAKAAESTQKAQEQAAALAKLDAPSKAQQRNLASLETAASRANDKVERLTAQLTAQGEKLTAVGHSVTDLAGAEQKIAAAAEQTGAAITKVGDALESYNETLDAYKSRQAEKNALDKAAAETAATAARAEAARVAEAERGYDAFERAARAASVADEQRTRAEEDRAARKLVAATREEQATLDQVAALNRLGATAAVAADELAKVGPATNTSKLQEFALGVQGIIDPAAQARATLEGLEKEATRLSAEIGDGKKPIADYQNAINDLGRVQAAVLKNAGAVDAYQAQLAVERQATAAVEERAARLRELAAAALAAKTPDDALTASIKNGQAALAESAAALEVERERLGRLGGALKSAGIDSNDLVKAQERIKGVAQTTAASLDKLNAAAAGKNNRVGAFLGLKPYELQNLSYQINDVVTQLGSGAKASQVAAQQGGQIFQLFQRQLGGLVAFLPELAIAAVVVGTAFLALKRQMDFNDTVKEFTKDLTLNADAANYNAKALALNARQLEDNGVKAADAKTALKTFVQEGFNPARMVEFVTTAKELARVTGQSIPDAATSMATAFKGGYAQVVALDDKLNFLTASERAQIKAMFDSGDAQAARTKAFDIFEKKLDGQTEKAKGPWLKTIENLKNVFISFLDAVGQSPPFKFLEDLLKRTGEVASAISGSIPGAGGKSSTTPGGGQNGIPGAYVSLAESDKQLLLRVALGESNQTVEGIRKVLEVVRNRGLLSGQSIGDVVRTGGFESINNKADYARTTERINSAGYAKTRDIMELIERVFKRLDGDAAGGATYFYSPSGQQKRMGDGRSLVPGFADGKVPVARDPGNGNLYFRGAYGAPRGGRAANANLTVDSEAEKKAFADQLDDAQKAYTLATKTNDELRVQEARKKAVNDAAAKGLTKEHALIIGNIAAATEQFQVDKERADQQRQLTSQLAASLAQAQNRPGLSLADRIKAARQAVDVQGQAADQQIEALRKTGFSGQINGQSLDQVKAQIDANRQYLKDQAELKLRADELREVEDQRAKALKEINDNYAAGKITATDAIDQTVAVNGKYAKQLAQMKADALAFAASIKGAKPDDAALNDFKASFSSAVNSITADNTKAVADFAKGSVDALVSARKTAFDLLTQQLQNREITPEDAFIRARDLSRETNQQIGDAATALLAKVKAVAGAKPSAELQKVIDYLTKAETQAGKPAVTPTNEAGKIGLQGVQSLNDTVAKLVQERSDKVSTYNALESEGALTTQEAQDRIKKAYQDSQPEIEAATAKVLAFAESLGPDVLKPEALESIRAKLQLINTQAIPVDANFKKIKDSATQAFSSGIVTAVDSLGDEIAGLIDHTKSFGDVLGDVSDIAANFFASFLKSIAQAIIQIEAMAIAQSLLKSLNSGSGVGGFIAGLFGAHHLGGIAGAPKSTRNVSAAAFLGAPRYHSGTPGVGLAADEVASILKKGEEVLTEDNPRHIRNLVGGGKAAPAPPVNVKVVNAFDHADVVSKGLATPEGETAVMNIVRQNATQIKATIGA